MLYYCYYIFVQFLHLVLVQSTPLLSMSNTSHSLIETDEPHVYTVQLPSQSRPQFTCNSSLTNASYDWYYCHGGGSNEEMMCNDSASLALDSDSLREGPYSCVVPGDGATSVFICIHQEEVNGSHSCDPNFTICNETSTDMNWRMVCTIATSVLLAILLVLALPIVIICVYRRCWGAGGHHQTEDYAVVDNLEVDTFHSIPYRRDGLPECPISLCNINTDHEASKKKDRSRFTWPPNSNKRTSKVHPPDTPIMTWYYSAGRPLPVWPQSSPSNSSDNGGLDYAYHRLLDKHDSENIRERAVGGEKREGGGGGKVRSKARRIGESVPVEQFEETVHNYYKDGMLGFQREFTTLYSGSERSVSVAKKNRSKNCFSNFYPYDDSRVVLRLDHCLVQPGSSDYINASYVAGFSRPSKFIATQAPLPHTVINFWRMVWQEKASCLVQLSLDREEGRASLGVRYCSDSVGTWCIGPFLVSTTHKTVCAHYTIRYISLQVSGSAPLETCQLQITRVSKQKGRHMASTLLTFHRRFTELTNTTTQPTVVHCSTGSGLSGVFMAVDCVLESVGEQAGVGVWGVVNSLRQQRPRMVATMEQYVLIHEVMLEWLKWGNTEIPVCQLTTATILDSSWLGAEGRQGIILENLLHAVGPVKLNSVTEQQEHEEFAHPLWITHTAPGTRVDAQSSSIHYHRPTSVSGYWPGSYLLVTHSPTLATAAQFWRTVMNKKCATIIAFSDTSKESYQYWSEDISFSTIAGQHTVHLAVSGESARETGGKVARSLTVDHAMSGRTHVVPQLVVLEWREGKDAPVQLLCKAAETILRGQNSNTHFPVLLHCSDGVSVCGVVCVVVAAVQQGLVEGLVDIPRAVRSVRAHLPTTVSTLDQMKLVVVAVTTLLNRKLRPGV